MNNKEKALTAGTVAVLAGAAMAFCSNKDSMLEKTAQATLALGGVTVLAAGAGVESIPSSKKNAVPFPGSKTI